MASCILMHLDGAATLMTLVQGQQKERVAQVQADRLVTLLRGARVSSSEASEAIKKLESVGFEPTTQKRVQDSIIDAIDPLEGIASDQKFQNYESLVHFLPKSVWDSASRPDGPKYLFEFLAEKLGLEKPSEGTLQVISLVLLAMSEGEEKALEMTPRCKNEYLKAVKRWWAGFWSNRKRQILDKELLWVLPPSPALLDPALVQQAFAEEGPEPCGLQVVQLERLKAGNWMRLHPRKSSAQPPSGQPTGGSMLAADVQSQPMQMMQFMATCFKEIFASVNQNATRPGYCPPSESAREGVLGPSLRVYTDAPRRSGAAIQVTDLPPSRSPPPAEVPSSNASTSASPLLALPAPPVSTTQSANDGPQKTPSASSVEDATLRVLAAMASKTKAKDAANGKRTRLVGKTPIVAIARNDDDDDDDSAAETPLPVKRAKTVDATPQPRPKQVLSKNQTVVKINHEKSRSQFLVRSTPSKQFKYGAGQAYRCPQAALQAAKAHRDSLA